MLIFPAIDLYGGNVVRLYQGNYEKMTVYSESPAAVAHCFAEQGAGQMHVVDLAGARDGGTPNLETICALRRESGLFTEVGGGIRSMETVERYLEAGIDRVILGTAAVTEQAFLTEAVATYGEKIAVGVDLRDGFVAVHGWTKQSPLRAEAFCEKLSVLGVKTLIVTDISRDGAMQGTNTALYAALAARFPVRLIASGGVSAIEDVRTLAALGLYGAIIGKAYYTGAVSLREAIEVAQ